MPRYTLYRRSPENQAEVVAESATDAAALITVIADDIIQAAREKSERLCRMRELLWKVVEEDRAARAKHLSIVRFCCEERARAVAVARARPGPASSTAAELVATRRRWCQAPSSQQLAPKNLFCRLCPEAIRSPLAS